MIFDSPVLVRCWNEEDTPVPGADVVLVRDSDRLQVQLQANAAPVSSIVLRWKVPLPDGVRILGDHWERGYGDLEWCSLVAEPGTRPHAHAREGVLPWYFLLHNPATEETDGFGVETGGGAFASWRVDTQGITLHLDVRCGGNGVVLAGRTLTAAVVRYNPPCSGESPFQAARSLCRMLCPVPRLPAFPVYGGNDWYYAYGNNSDDSIRRDAALIRELAPDGDNPPFMVIDAGWFPNKGCNGGPYDRGNDRFPDMAALAAGMRALGVRPGIWFRPLLTAQAPDSSRLPANHPIHQREQGVFLDPSVPEVRARVEDDMRRLLNWGYELIKFDFTTYDVTARWGFEMQEGQLTAPGWRFADTGRTTAEILRDHYLSLREAAGDALIIGCNTVGHLGAGLFDIQRTGDDTSGREWERTRKMGINTLAFRMPQQGTFFAADADCVGLTPLVPWEKNRQWLDVLARSGTPLFVSADPQAVGPEQRTALKEAFAIAARPQPVAEPLDWLHTPCPRQWKIAGETVTYDWTG